MTMKPWLAGALRRALASIGMVFVAEAAFYQTVHARPDLPPADVDRIEVVTMDGSRTITDRPTIRRVLAIVRSHRGEWTRVPDTVCLLGAPHAAFYRGTEPHGSILWGPQVIGVQSPRSFAQRGLGRRDGAELNRLLAP